MGLKGSCRLLVLGLTKDRLVNEKSGILSVMGESTREDEFSVKEVLLEQNSVSGVFYQ